MDSYKMSTQAKEKLPLDHNSRDYVWGECAPSPFNPLPQASQCPIGYQQVSWVKDKNRGGYRQDGICSHARCVKKAQFYPSDDRSKIECCLSRTPLKKCHPDYHEGSETCTDFWKEYCSQGNRVFLDDDCKVWQSRLPQENQMTRYKGLDLKLRQLPYDMKQILCKQENQYQTNPLCYGWCNDLINRTDQDNDFQEYRAQCRQSVFERGYCKADQPAQPTGSETPAPDLSKPPGQSFSYKCPSGSRVWRFQYKASDGLDALRVVCSGQKGSSDVFGNGKVSGYFTRRTHEGLVVYENPQHYIGGIAPYDDQTYRGAAPNRGKYEGAAVYKKCGKRSGGIQMTVSGVKGTYDEEGIRSLELLCN